MNITHMTNNNTSIAIYTYVADIDNKPTHPALVIWLTFTYKSYSHNTYQQTKYVATYIYDTN